MRAAARLGIRPAQFWRMAPDELRLIVDAENERRRDELRLAAAGGWFAAVFRGKRRLRPLHRELESMIPSGSTAPRPRSAREMVDRLRMAAALAGGRVIEGKARDEQ